MLYICSIIAKANLNGACILNNYLMQKLRRTGITRITRERFTMRASFLIQACHVFGVAFRAANICTYSLEFLAAIVAYIFIHISAPALEFHSKRISYATHNTSFVCILHASNEPTRLHSSSSSSPGILFTSRSSIITRP